MLTNIRVKDTKNGIKKPAKLSINRKAGAMMIAESKSVIPAIRIALGIVDPGHIAV